MTRISPLMTINTDFTQGPPGTPGNSQVSLLPATSGSPSSTAVRQWSVSRGRQYELDVFQAGTATLDVTDNPEWLNPVNSSSPFNSGSNSLLPYRCIQIGAFWNTTTKDLTGNLLNSGNNANISGTWLSWNPYYCSFETGIGYVGILAGSPTLAQSTAQAWDGTHSLAITFNGSTDLPGFGVRTVPGQWYTFSAYVYLPAGVTVTASLVNFPGALGSTIASASASTSGSWQRLVMAGVASGCVSVCTFQMTGGTFPATVYVDAVQLELGDSVSAFTAVGPTWFNLYTGYIERYPQRWDMAGFRGLRPLECVDALSVLSRTAISQSYAKTILADSPMAYMPLNDAATPQAVQLPQGGAPMTGYVQLGSQSATANFGGDSALDGSKAVTVVQQNTSPITINDPAQLTFIGTRNGNLSMNPQSFTIECWIKFTEGVAYLGAGTTSSTVGSVTGMADYIGWYTSGGQLTYWFTDPQAGGLMFLVSPGGIWWPDGKWHYAAISLIGSNQWIAVHDTTVHPVGTLTGSPSQAVNIVNLFAESTTYYGDPISQISVANMALYNGPLTSTQMGNHYQRGIGYLGELSGTRANRLLTQYWAGPVWSDTGKTSMATDFHYDSGTGSSMFLLDVLQEIAVTEGGQVWADAAGVVHQDSREARYTYNRSNASRFTFGENTAAGELPYLAVEYDYDPTYVYSQANFTSAGTGNTIPPIVNSTSLAAYGQRILTQTMQTEYDWDAIQAGQFYVQRYAKPAGAPGTNVPPRISKLTLDPASNPALWAAVLSLDLGDRITVKRRTSAGVTVSGDYYVEKIDHTSNADASTWTADYELSPVWNPQAWVLGDATKGVLGSTTVCVY